RRPAALHPRAAPLEHVAATGRDRPRLPARFRRHARQRPAEPPRRRNPPLCRRRKEMTVVRAFTLAALLILSAPARGQLPAPSGDAIVPEGAKLELLFTRTAPIKGGLTEGPAAAPDGSIYFSDIPDGPDKGMILRFDPKT